MAPNGLRGFRQNASFASKTMVDRRLTPDERHYSEPEILPPGRGGGVEPEYPRWRLEELAIRRIYVTKAGPFGLLSLALLGGIITIAILAFLFGFLLLLLPVVGLAVAAALIGSFLRGPR
jgi:hypothetical protein